MPPVRMLLLGLQHLLVWPGPGCAAEQLGSAGGWSRRPRELLGRGQAPGRGHQEPPYGPCVLPQQLSLSVALGAQSPGADGREMGESGKICFVSTPRLKLAERRGGCWSSKGGLQWDRPQHLPQTAAAPGFGSACPGYQSRAAACFPALITRGKSQGEVSQRVPRKQLPHKFSRLKPRPGTAYREDAQRARWRISTTMVTLVLKSYCSRKAPGAPDM